MTQRATHGRSIRVFFAVLTWAIASWALYTSDVLADASKTEASSFVVLPVTRNDERLDELRRRSVELEEELAARGFERVPHESAATHFQERHSREPRSFAADDLEVLLRESELARRAAAARENAEAKRYAERVQQRVADRLESANSDDAVARAYFAACWAQVRALVNENDAQAALGVGRRCVAEMPDLAPRLRDHPPSVMRIFERVTSELSGPNAAVLEVDSTPPGCRVLIDGRPTTTTPSRLRVPVDQRYALQVDCGGAVPPRVHELVSRSTPTVLAVDAMFERAVRTTDGTLRLVYESENDPATDAHARAVAQVLEVDEVFLLIGAERGALRIQRLGGKSQTMADARLEGVLSTAVNDLLRDDSDQKPSASRARAAKAAETLAPEPARWPLPTGIALGGVSLVLGGVGALMYRDHLESAETFKKSQDEPTYQGLGEQWQKSRPVPFAFVATASGLMTASTIMLTEPLSNKTRRWLSPVFAVVGVTVAAFGIRDIAQGRPCAKYEKEGEDLRTCVDDEEQLNRGGLITIAAAPFLITSMVHLGEWLWRGSHAAPTGLSLYAGPRELRATFRF
jgi:hypothetical protein